MMRPLKKLGEPLYATRDPRLPRYHAHARHKHNTIMHRSPLNNENVRPSSSSSSKMFSQLPPIYNQPSPYSPHHQNFYTPSRPSPLSSSPLRANRSPLAERDENASHSFTMSSPPPPTTNIFSAQIYGQSSQSAKSTGKRFVKKNPLIHRDEKDGGRETRRKLFLKRVREDSEDKRWDKKGGDDELLRSIYLSDHKRNIGKNLREDRAYDETPEDFRIDEEEPSDVHDSSQPQSLPMFHQASISQPIHKSLEEEMADEVARQEEAELQAYLEMMEAEEVQAQQQSHQQRQQIVHPSQMQTPAPNQEQNVVHIRHTASDEIDYDNMFEDMNMLTGVPDNADMMDMS